MSHEPSRQRFEILIEGCVQGVGFRPFIFRLAHRHGLAGFVSNTLEGVRIEIEGSRDSLSLFHQELILNKPLRSSILKIETNEMPLKMDASFAIIADSSRSDTSLALLPDSAVCQECLQELFDPCNRRYRYPFLHCISCGPRFSLFLSMPFDRERTAMRDFTMCRLCKEEYDNPGNRRFYSQTNCCPECGPKLKLQTHKGQIAAEKDDAVKIAAEELRKGKIIAMKNTGGYLLLCDALNPSAIERLRKRKNRPAKPFAILAPHLDQVRDLAETCPSGEEALSSPASPIVLLKKKPDASLPSSIAPDSPYFGIMLSHTPLQHLLMDFLKRPLIATSGNISDNPICIDEREAFDNLTSIADFFLTHNRQIQHRLDDSIVHIIDSKPVVLRKARGYIPYAIPIPKDLQHPSSTIFAGGSQIKNTFALSKHQVIYPSQHIGNLESAQACKAFETEVKKWEQLLHISPQIGACDLHPDYHPTRYIRERNLTVKTIQHHEAHVWACMADNEVSPPFFAISWDGTGLGSGKMIHGGEAFLATKSGLERFASLRPFKLPGGEKAIKDPRRSALGMLYAMEYENTDKAQQWIAGAFNEEERKIIPQALRRDINAPLCSSMGRLFDGICALLNCCKENLYEGHAPLILENLAYQAMKSYSVKDVQEMAKYDIPVVKGHMHLLDWGPMLAQILLDRETMEPSVIALRFHHSLALSILELAKIARQKHVLLTGGVMQNKILAELTLKLLKNAGFHPYFHRNIPPNDGGLAVGQLIGSLTA